MDDTLHWLGLMRFRWLLLGAVAVGCSLNPQPDLPAPRGGADSPSEPAPSSGGTGTGGTGGSGVDVGSGAASSAGSINNGGEDVCEGGAGGECAAEGPDGEGGVPGSAGAGTVTAKDAGAAGAEDVH